MKYTTLSEVKKVYTSGYDRPIAKDVFYLSKLPCLSRVGIHGWGRAVYALGEDHVLKVAYNSNGIAENHLEGRPGLAGKILPKFYFRGGDYVIVERATPYHKMGKIDQRRVRGLTTHIRHKVLYQSYHAHKYRSILKVIGHKYDVRGLTSLAKSFAQNHVWDIDGTRQWGVLKNGKIVLLDAGCTKRLGMAFDEFRKDTGKFPEQHFKAVQKTAKKK